MQILHQYKLCEKGHINWQTRHLTVSRMSQTISNEHHSTVSPHQEHYFGKCLYVWLKVSTTVNESLSQDVSGWSSIWGVATCVLSCPFSYPPTFKEKRSTVTQGKQTAEWGEGKNKAKWKRESREEECQSVLTSL